MIKPMLAFNDKKCNTPLKKLLSDPTIVMQPKLDGHRMLLEVNDGKVTGYNRKLNRINLPKMIEWWFCNSGFDGQWQFDGEFVSDVYWLFDITCAKGAYIQNVGYLQRLELLTALYERISITHQSYENTAVKLCPSWTENKQEHFDFIKQNNGEGVVFRFDSSYVEGRTDHLIKHKFVKEVDCIVTDFHRDSKHNCVVSVSDEDAGELVEVGEVSLFTGDGPHLKIGDVVTVSCLYVSESNRLVQPTRPRIRKDKTPDECSIGQLALLRTDKQIVEKL